MEEYNNMYEEYLKIKDTLDHEHDHSPDVTLVSQSREREIVTNIMYGVIIIVNYRFNSLVNCLR